MIITCPECDTKYRYDENRFDGEATKKVKCTSCGFSFEARHPKHESADLEGSTDLSIDRESQSAPDGNEGWPLGMADIKPPEPPPSFPTEPPVSAAEPVAEPPTISTPDSGGSVLPPDHRYSLAVIAGGQAGTVFQLHKANTVLGRGSAMDIQLRDSEVSRRHARLEICDGDVILTDLGTTNGTWFDGAKVETVELAHQDEFTLGSTTLMLIVTPGHGIQ